jgi:hypothetical protein
MIVPHFVFLALGVYWIVLGVQLKRVGRAGRVPLLIALLGVSTMAWSLVALYLLVTKTGGELTPRMIEVLSTLKKHLGGFTIGLFVALGLTNDLFQRPPRRDRNDIESKTKAVIH